jgi:2-polyprenyl-6-methoxyphenol hydroxylase-like FAD-dependent oxidoreductase
MYDVAIVGASISGCTLARLYGQAGLRVALLERHRSPETPKSLCGHFVLGGGHPVLERIGALERLREAGAAVGRLAVTTRYGTVWPSASHPVPPYLSARRAVIDPLLRELAATTTGVEVMLGHTVTELLVDNGVVVGVGARDTSGVVRRLRARLVVGADGNRSRVARLAGAAEQTFPNERTFAIGYFRRPPHLDDLARLWILDGHWTICAPTDNGLQQVAVMRHRRVLDETPTDHAGLAGAVVTLPGAPDLTAAEAVGRPVLSLDYPLVLRDPTPQQGLALVGDAAMTGDPVPAVGCTWALHSAAWLADATAPVLLDDADPSSALKGYRRDLGRLRRELRMQVPRATAVGFNPVQRLIWRAAPRDPWVAQQAGLVGMQAAPTTSLLSPVVLGRAARSALRSRRGTPLAFDADTAAVS